MDAKTHELVDKISESLRSLESTRLTRVEITAKNSTLPYKAARYREALMWRITELGRNAQDCFGSESMVSGILLARAAVETSAALWYLREKLFAALQADSVKTLDRKMLG